MTYIYALCDPDTQEVRYVGKTDDIQKRYEQHIWIKTSPNTYRKSWIKSLQKQGKQPLIKVLEEVNASIWKERERWWIAEMRRQGARLTNLTNGGDGIDGLRHTPESLKKMSEAHKGYVTSPETRAKLRETSKAYASQDEVKKKTSQIHTGKEVSDATRAKLSASRIGMEFSPEHRANLSSARKGKTPGNKGKPTSYEVKVDVSLRHRKLTSMQIEEIRLLINQGGMSQASIARQYNISPALITLIKKGYTYFYNEGEEYAISSSGKA